MTRFWYAAIKAIVVFFITSFVGFSAYAAPVTRGAQSTVAHIKVVATYSVLGDLVKNVTGNLVQLDVLVGADGDAHTFEPTPQDSIKLINANIIFENGLHFEPWLDGLYVSSGSKAKRVITTDGVQVITLGENDQEQDPHVWHDVDNAMIMVENISKSLQEADPEHAAIYKANAQKYLQELGELDHWVIDQLKDIPDENRKLVSSHDTLGYFAHRYGFEVIGAGIESPTTEASDPSAATIAALVNTIKESAVKVVFIENMHNPQLMHTIAKEAGVVIAPALYTDALGSSHSDGATYMDMMRHNARIFAEALKASNG